MHAEWAPLRLRFKFDARTSRGSMVEKLTYLIRLHTEDGRVGVGECALFQGLSHDDKPDYEQRLAQACRNPQLGFNSPYSSIRFGFESALDALQPPNDDFSTGRVAIPINGLIWMGDREEMRRRIDNKLAAGFRVLKMKIGGIDFEQEVELLRYIRSRYSADVLELRLDANGSFTVDNAEERLRRLAEFHVHSIEQPIKPDQWPEMARLCEQCIIPIALDEELIGLSDEGQMHQMLDTIRPQYIILKPSLCGGLNAADRWVQVADSYSIGHWFTSALESNIGLYAIARRVARRLPAMPQGLGTGQLFHNNIPSPLQLVGDTICCNPATQWQIPSLQWNR